MRGEGDVGGDPELGGQLGGDDGGSGSGGGLLDILSAAAAATRAAASGLERPRRGRGGEGVIARPARRLRRGHADGSGGEGEPADVEVAAEAGIDSGDSDGSHAGAGADGVHLQEDVEFEDRGDGHDAEPPGSDLTRSPARNMFTLT